jgi:hypothetical protein
MMRSRRQSWFTVVAMLLLSAWFVFDAQFNDVEEESIEASADKKTWQYEATYMAEQQKILEQGDVYGGTEDSAVSTSNTPQYTKTPTQITAVSIPSVSLPDRVVVMAKISTDDTRWVEDEMRDWQSAIYDIDIETPHNTSTLDPLTNSTLRTLRNKGREANAYLAYIVQNYDHLPSTIAFVHPHKDGYPMAWHTDNEDYSNVVSLRKLNIDFVQSNGYANLRCNPFPGCPSEIMPFRNPPEDHRTAEAAMPEAWRDLFNNTDTPQVLATPCCAQFAVSREQVRKRPLSEYRKFYTWLMETPLNDETSGRVFEYLWHVLFGQDPV